MDTFGNRSWRIETSKGPALQKLYRERTGCAAAFARELLIAVAASKTSQRPAARKATERRLLARWAAHGLSVPADWTDALPEFGAADVAVLEFIEGGVPLWDVLAAPSLAEARRADVLGRFAAAWCARHTAAIREGEAGLVQEHGTIRHVLVAGDRQVWIDLEQAFRPRRDVRPLIAKEVAGYLRSIWKRVGEERARRDIATIVAAYPDRAILRAAADEYLKARGMRRVLWSIDRAIRNERRRRAKYGAIEALAESLGA